MLTPLNVNHKKVGSGSVCGIIGKQDHIISTMNISELKPFQECEVVLHLKDGEVLRQSELR